jgi:uncharacterized protein
MSVASSTVIIPIEEGGRGGSGWLNTYTGRKFFPLDPDRDQIDIRDIAHALAAKNRYAGMTASPFSVAQHSVILSRLVSRENSLWALLHDASEAYLPDVPRPLKRLPIMAPYREAEERLMRAIADRFGLSWPEPSEVKELDGRMIPTEAAQVFSRRHPEWHNRVDPIPGVVIRCQRPEVAERSFLVRFKRLTGESLPILRKWNQRRTPR